MPHEAAFLRLVDKLTNGTKVRTEGRPPYPSLVSLLPWLPRAVKSFSPALLKCHDLPQVEINETGTTLRFKPGYITGGRITHECGTTRALGWFIEGLLPLALFRYLNEGVHRVVRLMSIYVFNLVGPVP